MTRWSIGQQQLSTFKLFDVVSLKTDKLLNEQI